MTKVRPSLDKTTSPNGVHLICSTAMLSFWMSEAQRSTGAPINSTRSRAEELAEVSSSCRSGKSVSNWLKMAQFDDQYRCGEWGLQKGHGQSIQMSQNEQSGLVQVHVRVFVDLLRFRRRQPGLPQKTGGRAESSRNVVVVALRTIRQDDGAPSTERRYERRYCRAAAVGTIVLLCFSRVPQFQEKVNAPQNAVKAAQLNAKLEEQLKSQKTIS